MSLLIFAMPGYDQLADRLAELLAGDRGAVETRHFPDGESYARLMDDVSGRDVIFVASLDRPDGKILPLMFAASTARELGAKTVGLVVPYLPYMRQDRRFHEGEAITSRWFAKLVSSFADWMVTIDPHLHRYHSLDEIYDMEAHSLQAAPLISAWISDKVEKPLLVGPDMESEQWVSAVAESVNAPFTILEKNRKGDRDVEVSRPDVSAWQDHTPILVDDIISTARTMIETIGRIEEVGLQPPICIGVHAVFAEQGYETLKEASPADIVTCNTIAHETNVIEVADLLADGIRDRVSMLKL
jgi:ribose-phosphate pyrophosphokinase